MRHRLRAYVLALSTFEKHTGKPMLLSRFFTAFAVLAGLAFSAPPAEAARNAIEIEILKQGDGAEAVRNSVVSVHYTGWLMDGTKFDSSLDRGQPFEFKLGAGQVIRGWDRGIEGMKVGGKRILIIPPHLGYGPRGAGGVIPPNATLKFEVELLSVTPPKYGNLDNGDLMARLERGVKVIDIRRPDEWAKTGLIDGSVRLTAFNSRGDFIPKFETEFDRLATPDEEVILICRAGNRSAVIANFLAERRGYTNVHHVTEGIEKWIKDGLPVVQ